MDNNVLAKVGNRQITREDMMNVIRSLPQNQLQQVSTEQGRAGLLNELISREILYLDAVDQNLEKDQEFKQALNDAKEDLLKQYAVQKLLKDIKATDEEIEEYYNKNKRQFVTEEEVHAKHILMDNEDTARQVAEEIKQGKSFEDAAKEYSTCPSKENGGDLGTFGKGKMVPEFEKAAFSLEIGELSHVVKSQFGYHLILVEEKKPAEIQPFESVKEQVKGFLLRQKQFQKYTTYTEILKGKYPVEINEESLR